MEFNRSYSDHIFNNYSESNPRFEDQDHKPKTQEENDECSTRKAINTATL